MDSIVVSKGIAVAHRLPVELLRDVVFGVMRSHLLSLIDNRVVTTLAAWTGVVVRTEYHHDSSSPAPSCHES